MKKHISFRVGFIVIGIVALLAIGLMWLQQSNLLATSINFRGANPSTRYTPYNRFGFSFTIATVNGQAVIPAGGRSAATVLVSCDKITQDGNQLVIEMSDRSQPADAAKGINYSVEVNGFDKKVIGSANQAIYAPGNFSIVMPFNCQQVLKTPYPWVDQARKARQYSLNFKKEFPGFPQATQYALVTFYLK